MLAVKTALAAQDTIPLLVFDEIDANVGGEIAHAVGAKMKAVSAEERQVLRDHASPAGRRGCRARSLS
jgi:DNA repair protein RecN (Recombination protein N)